MDKEILHEYRDKDNNLVRVRKSRTGEIYMDSYIGNEQDPEGHSRSTIKISSGDGRPTGHGKEHSKLN